MGNIDDGRRDRLESISPILHDAYQNNVVARICLDMYANGQLNYRSALEECVAELARQNRYFLDAAVHREQIATPRIVIEIPKP